MDRTRKVLTVSLGCDKNLVDSERMLGTMRERGYTFTDDETEATAAVINTCCFIHDAKEESWEAIRAFAGLRQEGSLKALIVTGCLAQRYRKEIREKVPFIDAILGTASGDRIADALDLALSGKQADFFDDINRKDLPYGRRILSTGGVTAYLKIAEGCDKRCTYCIIPSLRGKYRSADPDTLVAEAKSLDAQGVRELILVAQETTLYGTDLYGKKHLAQLLKRLCDETTGIAWFRLLYCYPEEIDDDLIRVIREEKKIVPYLDIPVQSGSDDVLRRMGRHTSNAEIRALVTRLRREIPGVCLRTTLISGFPGERASDHNATKKLVNDLRFDRLGVFTYSREAGTPAAEMEDQVSEPLKKRRRTEIMKLQQAVSRRNAEAMIGRTLDVLVEGELEEDDDGNIVYAARTYLDAPDVDGLLFFTGRKKRYMSGDFARVRVTDAEAYDLIGEEIRKEKS